jgi:hypothetical protein
MAGAVQVLVQVSGKGQQPRPLDSLTRQFWLSAALQCIAVCHGCSNALVVHSTSAVCL